MVKWRRRVPEIQFVTSDERAERHYPPRPAIQAAPEWFKKTPAFSEQRRIPGLRLRSDSTIRGCPGVVDYLSLGYSLPLWCDLIITADETGFAFEVAGDYSAPDVFQPDQWQAFPRSNGEHEWPLKLVAPWRIRTPKGWSTLVLGPWYARDSRWSVLPGVVDTDRLGVLSPVLVWQMPTHEPTLLKAGTPLVHLIPFRRSAIDLSVIHDGPHHQRLVAEDELVTGNRLAPGAYREHARNIRDGSVRECR